MEENNTQKISKNNTQKISQCLGKNVDFEETRTYKKGTNKSFDKLL